MMGLNIPECMVQVNNKYDSSIFICVSFVYHLDEIIGRLIEKEAGLFSDLAAYSIVTANNAGPELRGCL